MRNHWPLPVFAICFMEDRDYYRWTCSEQKKSDPDSDNCHQKDSRNMDRAGRSERV